MTKPQSHKNATHVIIGPQHKPLLTYINSLFKEPRQYTLTPTLSRYMAPNSRTYDYIIKIITYIHYHYTHHVCKPDPKIPSLLSERGNRQDGYVQQNYDDYHQHR